MSSASVGSKDGDASPKLERQRTMQRNPPLRVRVNRDVLEGGANGPCRRSLAARLCRRLRPRPAVPVERLPYDSPSVVYAPESVHGDVSDCPFAPTQLLSTKATLPANGERDTLVYKDSPFEIRIAGMMVKCFDEWLPFGRDNELLMYSLQTDPADQGNASCSLPLIHFHYERDGYKATDRPNTYIPIPASKSFVLGSRGHSPGTSKCSCQKQHATKNEDSNTEDKASNSQCLPNKNSVNVQFKIFELDEISDNMRQSIQGIDDLGRHMAIFSSAAPSLGIVSPALCLASAVGRGVLDSYAKPDRVISIDMDFLLADKQRVKDGTAPNGEYLRYGYYFFLAEPFEGKLYASVCTPKNVQLMLRRDDHDTDSKGLIRKRSVRAREYFPLTEVSYLVVRVSEPTGMPESNRNPFQMARAQQIQNIFRQVRLLSDSTDVCNGAMELAANLAFAS